MADEQSKTEEATSFKLDEARKKGQVAKSVEFMSVLSMGVALAVAFVVIPESAGTMSKAVADWIGGASSISDNMFGSQIAFVKMLSPMVSLYLTISGCAVLAVIFAYYIHAVPALSFDPIKPKLSKLNPISGFKRIFSKKTLLDLVKTVLKFMAFIGVVWFFLSGYVLGELHKDKDFVGVFVLSWYKAAMVFAGVFFLVIFVFSLLDLLLSRKEFSKQMRMSKKDIKDEHKRRDGDPEIKSRRKKNQAELLAKLASAGKVADADVVVVNPTHYAVALQFRPEKMILPIVLSKGRGLLAQHIIQAARKSRVPILRRVGLARSLEKNIQIGSPIKQEHRNEVVGIYKWIVSQPNNKVVSK